MAFKKGKYMTVKKKVVIALLLLVSHSTFYILGSIINRNVMLGLMTNRIEEDIAKITLGRYVEDRQIVLDIKGGNAGKAKCMAELFASNMYDDLKSCLGKQNCRSAMEQKIHQFAPEVLGEVAMPFTYIESKNGIRSCESILDK